MRYVRPHDVDEAVAEVAAGGLPLAGGSVVVPLIARGSVAPSTLVDVGALQALGTLAADGDEVVVGASVTLERLQALEPDGAEALREAAAGVGNPLVRRLATVGGNVASGLATADLVPALLVLDAEGVWAGADGEAREPIAETIGRPPGAGRLLTSLRVRPDTSRRSGFAKFAWRRATGGAVASVAFAARRENGAIADPRLAVGGFVAPGRLATAESLLAGRPWDSPPDEAAAAAADEAAERAGLQDPDDLHRRLVALGVRQLVTRLGAQ